MRRMTRGLLVCVLGACSTPAPSTTSPAAAPSGAPVVTPGSGSGTRVVWTRTLPPQASSLHRIAVAADGLVVTGAFDEPLDLGGGSLGKHGWYVAKLDRDGKHVWSRAVPIDSGGIQALAVAGDGSIWLGGAGRLEHASTRSVGRGNFLARYSAAGELVLSRELGPLASALVADRKGVMFVGHSTDAPDVGGGRLTCQRGLVVARFALDGAHAWSRCAETSLYSQYERGALLANGDLAVCVSFKDDLAIDGTTYRAAPTSAGKIFEPDVLLLRLAAGDGRTVWASQIGAWGQEWCDAMVAAPDGDVVVAGFGNALAGAPDDPDDNYADGAIAKLAAADGKRVWGWSQPRPLLRFKSVAVDAHGRTVAFGVSGTQATLFVMPASGSGIAQTPLGGLFDVMALVRDGADLVAIGEATSGVQLYGTPLGATSGTSLAIVRFRVP